LERLAKMGSLPGALCNPKGRVVSVLRMLMMDGDYGLVLPASLAESLCERLKVYRLRADVKLDIANTDWACLIINADSDLDKLEDLGLIPAQQVNACRIADGLIAINIGIEERCFELMGFAPDFEQAGIDIGDTASADFLRGAKIRAGIPEIAGPQSEKYTPHMLNLDLLGAMRPVTFSPMEKKTLAKSSTSSDATYSP
jgi:folate-binding Fe-S cluster repair protein YgfZ